VARNKLLVPGAGKALDQLKQQVAQEMGTELGADTTARANGKVGGMMTKHLVQMAEQAISQQQNRGK
jgi:hypothetical protein